MNIFTAASPAPLKVKKTKANTRTTHSVEGLAELCAINALMDSLEGMKATYEGKVKSFALGIFAQEAMDLDKKPDTFNLNDGDETGQFQLRKRSSTSPLTDAEVAILTGFGIPTAVNIKQEECFKFKQEVLADAAIAQRISDALTADPVLAGMDLIVKQDAIQTTIVADNSIDYACITIEDINAMLAILKIVGVQALKTKFSSPEIQVALDTLKAAGHDVFAA